MIKHDVIIIGTGSGNSLLTPDFDALDVAIIEKDAFGGTCLNRGCIPSKMYVYSAKLAHLATQGARYGIDTSFNGADWVAIRDRVFGRIDPIAAGGEEYRKGQDHVTVYSGEGRFVGPKQIEVDGQTVTADQIVLAAGAHVHVPDIPGLQDSGFHTSDTIMRIDQLPERLVVLGGGFIAAELGNVFGSLGVDVTFVLRSEHMLRSQDRDVSERFTDEYASRFTVIRGARVDRVERSDGTVHTHITDGNEERVLESDMLLVATGRTPNGQSLGVDMTGVAMDDRGYVIVDDHQRTNVDGIWALGDISNPNQLKHVANAEVKVVAHNLIHPEDLRSVDLGAVPSAVFADPQVATIGATEQELEAAGTPYITYTQEYGSTAYGWALEDTVGICKLVADPDTRMLLGAHLMGEEAATLIQQLIQGMRFGRTIDEMASKQYYIHPALGEVVENALLGLAAL